jgi:tetratricopeptide (TPR) repeat protein
VEWARTGELETLKYGEEAMKYIEDSIACSQIYCRMAEYAYQQRNDNSDALNVAKEYAGKSLDMAPYEKFKARPKHVMGLILFASNQEDNAYDAYIESARMAEENHLEAEHAAIRCDMAMLLSKLGHPEMALAEFTHAENIASCTHDPIIIASCSFRKAQYLIAIGERDTACQLIASLPHLI